MKRSTEDIIAGKAHEVKGKVKQEAGRITRNRSVQAEGFAEKQVGKAQGALGKAERNAEKDAGGR